MSFELHWWNGLWLILPLMGWNLLFGPRITDERVTSDAHLPKWLLAVENGLRVVVFVLPLLIPVKFDEPSSKVGLAVYILGTLIYFASWIPLMLAPHSVWSNSPAGLLAPRITPFLPFLGLALIGSSWGYGLLAAVLILVHTWHGVQNLRINRTA